MDGNAIKEVWRNWISGVWDTANMVLNGKVRVHYGKISVSG